jgi:hypothetical protein
MCRPFLPSILPSQRAACARYALGAGPLNAKTRFLKINDGIIILRDRVLDTQQLIMNNLQQL